MAGKAQKNRNTASSAPRPSAPSSSPRGSDSPTPANMTSVLATEAFRRELLTLLREDIGHIIKLEIREVLEREMIGRRGDINTVKTKLQSYRSSVAKRANLAKRHYD